MTERKKVPISAERRDEMFAKLRRTILVARLKVTLDQELNRPTTPAQKALAEMKLPPMRSRRFDSHSGQGSKASGPAHPSCE